MMNKLVAAAVVSGTALACGVLPAMSAAAAVAPTPIPVQTVPTAPAAPVTSTPHAPSHRTPSHHRAPGGHRKGKPGKGKGKTGTGKAGPVKPVTHKPIVRKPVVHKPVVGPPTTGARMPAATTRIIGGRPATNAPWAVQVGWDDTGFECSGTAVAPQWVLTARHCVNRAGMTVLIGSPMFGKGEKGVVDDKVVAPTSDLALLHLTQPVRTTYVTLADEDPEVGAINEIYGWGKTDPASGPSAVLKTARVKVASLDCEDSVQGKAICSTGITGTAY
ncbi:MAG TPA: trypsin-like serine protease, partial [Pseudonocardiaceae bacterium]